MRFSLLILAMMLALLALFGLAVALEVPFLTDPTPWLGRGGWIGAAVGVILLVVDVALPVPSSLVMIAHGALFGAVGGTLLSLVGGLGAALVGFGLGRLGGPLVDRLVPPEERRRADELLGRWGGLALVVTRPVPILAETTAILAGTSSMGWGSLTLSTFAGLVPASLLYALTGAAAVQLDQAPLIFGLVLLVAGLFWAVGAWVRRSPAGRRSEEPSL